VYDRGMDDRGPDEVAERDDAYIHAHVSHIEGSEVESGDK